MNLAKGTRVRMTKPLKCGDKIGEIYEVERTGANSVTLIRKREFGTNEWHGFGIGICGYGLSDEEFAEHFEVIGMEKTNEKQPDKLIGDFTEEQLDRFWKDSDSYETFKKKLKLAVTEKPKKSRREWTLWNFHPITGFLFSVSHPEGKSAKVKVKIGNFVGIASCNPEDVWDLDLGVKLAAARAEVKRAKALANEKMENLHSIMQQIYGKAAK